ncbi:MAG: 23S rRNA (adenine(2503)-C(2))-methyltransferase RlmN [Alphaproteobacteria bacterium]|nr:23S rRNA (adenine(2503)-C(2))-methyltransferase RlmN [Alphaproteobacteria bacterium]
MALALEQKPARSPDRGFTDLLGRNRGELAKALGECGVPERQIKMRTAQLWNWLYVNGVDDFGDMSNMSGPLRHEMAARFALARPHVVSEQVSVDGTRKWLLRFMDENTPNRPPVEVETVYIPEAGRGTLCVSSQVGCTLNCSFCLTGTQMLVRNLSAGEIIAQVLLARRVLGDLPGGERPKNGLVPRAGVRAITNVVLMGMGEPLYNYENVKAALLTLIDGDGISLSRRRVTLSTSGVVPFIEPAGRETGVMLAISLHAVRDELRNELVPINKKWPIAELLAACRTYPGASNARRITFEYVMLKGINDSDADARELVRLLDDIPAKINLIPFNPWPGSPHECSSWTRIEKFADIINIAGYASPIRTPRGRDIFAACGQLKSVTERPGKSKSAPAASTMDITSKETPE